MIPVHLQILGFLSYHDPTDLDFTGFEIYDRRVDKVLLSKYETPKSHKAEKE